MCNFKKNWFNSNWGKGFDLVLYSIAFVWFGFYLVKNCIYHEAISKIIASLVWSLLCLSWAILNWRKLIAKKPAEEVDDIARNAVFSEKWRSEDLPGIIAIAVLLIPLIVVLIIVFTNDELTTTYLVSEPSDEIKENWAAIFLGVGFFFQTVEEIVDIKQTTCHPIGSIPLN